MMHKDKQYSSQYPTSSASFSASSMPSTTASSLFGLGRTSSSFESQNTSQNQQQQQGYEFGAAGSKQEAREMFKDLFGRQTASSTPSSSSTSSSTSQFSAGTVVPRFSRAPSLGSSQTSNNNGQGSFVNQQQPISSMSSFGNKTGSLLGGQRFSAALTTTTNSTTTSVLSGSSDVRERYGYGQVTSRGNVTRQPTIISNDSANNARFELPNPFGPMYDISLAERLGATSPEIDELIRQELSKTGANLDDDEDYNDGRGSDTIGPSDVQSLMTYASPPEENSNGFGNGSQAINKSPQIVVCAAEQVKVTSTATEAPRRQLKRYIDTSVFELPPSLEKRQTVLVQPKPPSLDEILRKEDEPGDVEDDFKKKFPNLASLSTGSIFSKSLEDELNPELDQSPFKNIEAAVQANVDIHRAQATSTRDYSHIFGPSWTGSGTSSSGQMFMSNKESALENAVKIGHQINQFINESRRQTLHRLVAADPVAASTNPFITAPSPHVVHIATTKQVRDDDFDFGSKTPSPPPPILNLTSEFKGEVYTIPEEEEEYGSPTAPDGVSSLSRHKRGIYIESHLIG